MTKGVVTIGRRHALAAAGAALILPATRTPLRADTGTDAGAFAAINALNEGLVAAMKAGDSTPFVQRYQTLAPVIKRVFDLDAILAASVGLTWAAIPDSQKTMLAAAFRRYTISTYVANFDSFNGQRFEILPPARAVGNGEVVVRTQLVRPDDSPVELDYVMRSGPDGFQVVDVLTDGSISRVAVQRSDFRQMLESGGTPALTAGLDLKVANLAGSMMPG
ncbi:MAG TPA: ABC transporter substrate-binding protein [Acetobacteraceae bacterium]|nr:ABC transporter substrate-binding protein [Acetobacteraceae bacterium]